MKRNIATASLILFSALATVLYSCTARRVVKDNQIDANANPQLASGQRVFKTNCQKCHPNGEAGMAPSLNNIHIPGLIVRYKIRSRSSFLWLGSMPSFKKHEISSNELNDLMAYLKNMRRQSAADALASK